MRATQLVKQGTDEEMAIAWQVSNVGGVRQVWHDGATVGQQALLVLVPARQLAVALLTNSVRGERFNRGIARAALQEYLGVTLADPPPIAVTESDLASSVGRYSRPFSDVVVTRQGERLMIQVVLKQGFPTPSSPIPPPAPAVPYAFYAKDRLIGIAGAAEGERAELLRRPDGTIGWIRVRGRLARRVE